MATITQRTTAKRITVLVRDLCAGDVFTTAKGERLTVRSVDAFGACAIVDFTDGTATPPVLSLSQVAIDRPDSIDVKIAADREYDAAFPNAR